MEITSQIKNIRNIQFTYSNRLVNKITGKLEKGFIVLLNIILPLISTISFFCFNEKTKTKKKELYAFTSGGGLCNQPFILFH